MRVSCGRWGMFGIRLAPLHPYEDLSLFLLFGKPFLMVPLLMDFIEISDTLMQALNAFVKRD